MACRVYHHGDARYRNSYAMEHVHHRKKRMCSLTVYLSVYVVGSENWRSENKRIKINKCLTWLLIIN